MGERYHKVLTLNVVTMVAACVYLITVTILSTRLDVHEGTVHEQTAKTRLLWEFDFVIYVVENKGVNSTCMTSAKYCVCAVRPDP